MKLMYELSEVNKQAIDNACGDEKQMYCLPFQILNEKFVDGYIVITNKHIYKLVDGNIINKWCLAQGKDFKTEIMYGSGAFYGTFNGVTYDIAQFTVVRHNPRYKIICRACEILSETGNDTPITDKTKERFCPKCGRPFARASTVCPHCIDKKEIYKKLWAMTKGMRLMMFAPFIVLMLATVVRLLDPLLQRIAVNNFIGVGVTPEARVANGGTPVFLLIVAGIVAINVFARAMHVLQGRLTAISSGRFSVTLRTLVYEKINLLSLSSVQKRSTGDLMGRVNNDTAVIQSFIINQFPNIFIQVFMIIVATISLLFINWIMALFILVPVPFAIFVISKFWSFMQRKNQRLWVLNTRTGHLLQDILNGIRVVKTFGREQSEIERFKASSSIAAYETEINQKRWATLFPAISFFIRIGTYFIMLYGSFMVYRHVQGLPGGMQLGDLVQFNSYATYIYAPLMWMTDIPHILSSFLTSAGKVFEILEETPDINDIDLPVDIVFEGGIELSDVTFGYESYSPVLEDVSVKINPGEMIGIVGHSGSGKSTLINLIMRLYETNKGKILIDGVNIKDISQASLRQQIGIVPQETFLFSGSIRDNIAYSNPRATDEEIINAAKIANAHDFIISLPQGYDTYVGEKGHSLSGGERQRVAIARAIIHNPKILILDEATAALDTETEKLIQDALNSLSKGRTTIAIAHRLATLKDADKLLVLDNGKAVEFGTHKELLDAKGIYYKLVCAQKAMAFSLAEASGATREHAESIIEQKPE